ncbi:MAG: heavy-metal-associated domain-containing protein [Burkholderiales bacterium]
MEIVIFNVKGMSCMGCVNSVKNVLEPIPGVAKVEVSLETGQVAVSFDASQARPDQFKAAIEGASYEVIA